MHGNGLDLYFSLYLVRAAFVIPALMIRPALLRQTSPYGHS